MPHSLSMTTVSKTRKSILWQTQKEVRRDLTTINRWENEEEGSRRTTTLWLRKLRKWKDCPLTNGAREHIRCSEITSKIWLDWARAHIQGLWSSVGQTTWKSVGQRQSPNLDFIQDLLRRVLPDADLWMVSPDGGRIPAQPGEQHYLCKLNRCEHRSVPCSTALRSTEFPFHFKIYY